MITLDLEQGGPEWFAARAGIPTASNFDKIITTKGEPSKSAKKYMYQLAGERILGAPVETYTNGAMERGIALEAEAREMYGLTTGNEVRQVGLCYQNEERCFSCSPDGLTDIGGLEIKCPLLSTHVEYLLKGKLPTEYFQQVQGSLFVTGLPWWDFFSYYPGMPPFRVRVTPDELFHNALSAALSSFCSELDNTVDFLRSK